jgi:hypothetical protein
MVLRGLSTRVIFAKVAEYQKWGAVHFHTKSTEALDVTLDHRVCEVELEGLEASAHVAELVRACWELGDRPAWTESAETAPRESKGAGQRPAPAGGPDETPSNRQVARTVRDLANLADD